MAFVGGPKFVRALDTVDTLNQTTGQVLPYMLKLIYEFWGFCIHGQSPRAGGLSEIDGYA